MGADTSISFDELKSCNNTVNKEKIINSVLNGIGAVQEVSNQARIIIHVYYGKIQPNKKQKDALISIQFDSKNTVIVLYGTEDGKAYHFVSFLGRFYTIKEILFLFEKENNSDIILLKEFVSMKLGCYEDTTFLKGYIWDNCIFKQVLEIVKDVEALWNSAWVDNSQKEEWEKVVLTSETKWAKAEALVLFLYETQEYSISTEKNEKILPDKNTFQPVNNRFVQENFIWNKNWNRFILFESIYKKTGKKVAVIQNLSNSPYSLVEGPIEKCVIYDDSDEIKIISQKDLEQMQ